jgi:hypothetical protein
MTDQSEPSTPPKPRLTQTARGQTIFVSLWVLGTLVTLGLWVGAFVLGQSVGAPEDAAVEEVIESAESAPQFPELGPPPQAPGTWAWDELRGGECLTGFSDPFAEQFQVVSCSSPHNAELLHAELLSRESSEPYPGDPAVLAAARAACDVRDLVNIEVAQEFSDLRTGYSYPVSQDQWEAGERGVYCFVYSESGATFESSLR